MKFIVVSCSGEMIGSIKRYLKYVHSIYDVESVLVNNPENNAYENFLVIRGWLKGLFQNDITAMKRTMAFIDLPIFEGTEFVPTSDKAEGLAALLYLSFPEIFWVFLAPPAGISTDECLDQNIFNYFHVLMSGEREFNLDRPIASFMHGYTPLFDPGGMRHFIIKKTLEHLNESEEKGKVSRPFFCKREKKALVVDEELAYSYLHAYVAYKFGHKVLMAATKRILDDLNESKPVADVPHTFHMSFEDICLSFPDKAMKFDKSEQNLLEKRDEQYKFFKKIPRRIFVTIGESRGFKKKNREYRQSLKYNASFEFYKMLYKPYAGIFNIRKEARLKKNGKKNGGGKNTDHGHSQPGRLGLIAGVLIDRSNRVLSQVENSNDAVYAALLALQAQEILGGRTATLSIKAISLKHQAEVKAECMFYGVEHNFDVKSRFKEIEDELAIIGRWFTKSKRDIMIYNSALNIVNELARIFRQYSQFDEELICMNEVRKLNRGIYRKRNKLRGWLVSPLRWYFELLIGSLPRFLTAIVLWPALFTLLFYIASPENIKSLGNAFICAINAFFALQVTMIGDTPGVPALSIFATIIGFFHLGVFISHLYTIVSRR